MTNNGKHEFFDSNGIIKGSDLVNAISYLTKQAFAQLVLAANLAIVGICLFLADRLMRLLGQSVAMAISKVFMLILAAYSVMMIRYGVLSIVAAWHQ